MDIYKELEEFGVNVDVYDPWASNDEVKREFGVDLIPEIDENKKYQAVILAVSHDEFKDLDFSKYQKDEAVIFDVKSALPRQFVDARL